MSANLISVQVILAADDDANATACAAGFAELGFTTEPAFAGSFALVGNRAAFRRAFGVVPDGIAPELALDKLAPKLRRLIRAVVSTPPPAFGPGNP